MRRSLGTRTRRLLAGRSEPPAPPADDGWFGPDSAAWVVHRDAAVLVGGIRALLLQTLHPLAMAGVADHSSFRDDPLGRLHRTAGFLGQTIFGSADDAAAAVARVRSVHDHVRGVAPDGRQYRADDPHLLGWVHATEVDSFLAAHRRYGTATLSAADADRYVAEMARIGVELGMANAPRTAADLDATLDGYRPELAVTDQSREAVRFLLWAPLPLAARPPYGVLFAAAAGLLPPWARSMTGLPVVAEPILIRPAATVVVRTLGWALGYRAPDAHR